MSGGREHSAGLGVRSAWGAGVSSSAEGGGAPNHGADSRARRWADCRASADDSASQPNHDAYDTGRRPRNGRWTESGPPTEQERLASERERLAAARSDRRSGGRWSEGRGEERLADEPLAEEVEVSGQVARWVGRCVSR